jgi:hypothetical protein
MSTINVSNIAFPQPSSPTAQASSAQSAFWQKYLSERRPEVQQLKEALKSGDLSAAQQAYNDLVALGNQVLHRDNPFLRPDRALDFNAVGGALQNGDLDGARQAFAALQDTFRQKLPPVVSAATPPTAAVLTLSNSSSAGLEVALQSGNASEAGVVPKSSINVVA